MNDAKRDASYLPLEELKFLLQSSNLLSTQICHSIYETFHISLHTLTGLLLHRYTTCIDYLSPFKFTVDCVYHSFSWCF